MHDEQLNANAVRCAQWYASQGAINHKCPYKNGAGENLAYNYEKTQSASARQATEMWYNEVKKYDYNRPGFSMATGHFTQVVWKNSRQFGIGVYQDPSSGRQYVCALYSPPGNYQGQFPENVLQP